MTKMSQPMRSDRFTRQVPSLVAVVLWALALAVALALVLVQAQRISNTVAMREMEAQKMSSRGQGEVRRNLYIMTIGGHRG
jgi:hypothetical protein